MREVAIIGVGAHPAGRFPEKSLKELAYPAIWNALDDAGVNAADVEVAYFGNSLAGLLTGQEGIRGQVVLAARGHYGHTDHQCRERLRQRDDGIARGLA